MRTSRKPESSRHSQTKSRCADRWERLKEESAKAYEAFTVYRDLPTGERSLTLVSRQLGKSKSLCARWSTLFGWVERAMEWDSFQDRLKRNRAIAEREKIYERQLQHSRIASQALMAPMIALAKRAQTKAEPFAGVSDYDLAKLASFSARALPRIHEDERTLAGPAQDSEVREQQPVTISGAKFTWVESTCDHCGHLWGQHDQSTTIENGAGPMPCTVAGCDCSKWLEGKDSESGPEHLNT